jgi:hypothetical protein
MVTLGASYQFVVSFWTEPAQTSGCCPAYEPPLVRTTKDLAQWSNHGCVAQRAECLSGEPSDRVVLIAKRTREFVEGNGVADLPKSNNRPSPYSRIVVVEHRRKWQSGARVANPPECCGQALPCARIWVVKTCD